MSYPGSNPVSHQHNGDGAIAVVQGAIIIGPGGPQTQMVIGALGTASMGDTEGPNAVNPSGTVAGVRLPTQNNFRSTSRSRRRR
jgi:hypothetical protein